jgi:hypothetical protein
MLLGRPSIKTHFHYRATIIFRLDRRLQGILFMISEAVAPAEIRSF